MTWVIVVVAVVVAIALAAVAMGQRRSAALKRHFGPEYDRIVDEKGDRRTAEAELRDRAKRRNALELHELSHDAVSDYSAQWRDVQSDFVNDPRQAVADADGLVREVMRERGYPVDGFDERLEMVSVDHPELAENYRVAHAVQRRSGAASIDDLREAFQRYRALFEDLLADSAGVDREPRVDGDDGAVRDERNERDVPDAHDVR
jgi:hypothetical protein